MATWNGSYPEDGSNYYINNSINQTPANVTTWDYYLPDSNRTYNSYPVDQSMIFEQNTSDEAAAYYSHANRNVISSPVSNVAMNANYSNNAIQSTVSNKVSQFFHYIDFFFLLNVLNFEKVFLRNKVIVYTIFHNHSVFYFYFLLSRFIQ